MNIFYLSHDTKVCAAMHCDKHVVKMILEYAQLLSTAHRVLDGTKVGKGYFLDDYRENKLYKATHVNHPCAIWARAYDTNYIWLWHLLDNLCKEYTIRYNKHHKVEHSLLKDSLSVIPNNIPQANFLTFIEPPQCMPDTYRVESTLASYRNYYKGAKSGFAKWKTGNIPHWWNQPEKV